MVALALAALSAACQRADEPRPVGVVVAALPALDARQEPLRARFDAERDTPRVLVLASPT
jgi:hypothetical protein